MAWLQRKGAAKLGVAVGPGGPAGAHRAHKGSVARCNAKLHHDVYGHRVQARDGKFQVKHLQILL